MTTPSTAASTLVVIPAFAGDSYAYASALGGERGVLATLADDPGRKLFPFGAGPRFCPGRYLAMAEIKMVMSMMAKNFSLQRVAGRAAPPRLSACAEGTWFDDCAPDCCVKVLRGATGPRPTIAQRPQGEPLPVALDEAGEVRWS